MASVIFPKKQFEKEIGKLDEKMQNKIAMFGTPFEKYRQIMKLKLKFSQIVLTCFPIMDSKEHFLGFLGKQKGLKNIS